MAMRKVYVEVHSFWQNAPSLFFEFDSRAEALAALGASKCVRDGQMAGDVFNAVKAHDPISATRAKAAGRTWENTVVTFDRLPNNAREEHEVRELMLR